MNQGAVRQDRHGQIILWHVPFSRAVPATIALIALLSIVLVGTAVIRTLQRTNDERTVVELNRDLLIRIEALTQQNTREVEGIKCIVLIPANQRTVASVNNCFSGGSR